MRDAVPDVVMMPVPGVIWSVFAKLDCPPTASMLASVLGGVGARSFRRSMIVVTGAVAADAAVASIARCAMVIEFRRFRSQLAPAARRTAGLAAV